MIDLILKQYPNAALLIFATVIAFSTGGVWVNYRYMRRSMVTKTDLNAQMLAFELRLSESISQHYIRRSECAAMRCAEPTNGHAKAKSFHL